MPTWPISQFVHTKRAIRQKRQRLDKNQLFVTFSILFEFLHLSKVVFSMSLVMMNQVSFHFTKVPFYKCPKRKRPLFNETKLKVRRSKQKIAYQLFYFLFLGFEIDANRFSIKFCIRKSNSFFLKRYNRGTKLEPKQPNLKIWVKVFLKCHLWSIAAKLENVETNIF